MPRQAKLKAQYQEMYPALSAGIWYDIEPLFQSGTQRTLDAEQERIGRIRTLEGSYATVRTVHFEFRDKV